MLKVLNSSWFGGDSEGTPSQQVTTHSTAAGAAHGSNHRRRGSGGAEQSHARQAQVPKPKPADQQRQANPAGPSEGNAQARKESPKAKPAAGPSESKPSVHRRSPTSQARQVLQRAEVAEAGGPQAAVTGQVVKPADARSPKPSAHVTAETGQGRGKHRQHEETGAAAPSMNEVVKGIFLGSIQAAQSQKMLLDAGITHVLPMNSDEPLFPGVFDYKVKMTQTEDLNSLVVYLPHNIAYLDAALKGKGKVLVYDHRGVNRSASLVIAYLMWRAGLSCDQALEEVRKRRPPTQLRSAMVAELQKWDRLLKDPEQLGLLSLPARPAQALLGPPAQPDNAKDVPPAQPEDEGVIRVVLTPLLAGLKDGTFSLDEVVQEVVGCQKHPQFSQTAFETVLRKSRNNEDSAAVQAAQFSVAYVNAIVEREKVRQGLSDSSAQAMAQKCGQTWVRALIVQCETFLEDGKPFPPSAVGEDAKDPLIDEKGKKAAEVTEAETDASHGVEDI
eukprot:CAMPEP_0174292818 /NCGR_PEP_ID=MMETSP0809-20121228/36604_1 /TAXON_ID=73025 ORGANISM="Eutreptiella gymnastica-like, Strain CCMP1594" /NCGR_SAMPLE_ID=MMETSP0809 /ASSEMBLY_ACC=CAM_ASM_000658 /LENGTH=500 /DNA_ID=CAMNT_0015393133 /DNA_START=29 /DNA_END=1532 /DNA_ORIENTATION=+